MMETDAKKQKTGEQKARAFAKYGFALAAIVAGMLLNYFEVGSRYFAGFESLGSWLIYVGFLMILVASLSFLKKKRELVDERALFIAGKAYRVTFIALVLAAFAIMLADGIQPISYPYHMFMSFLVCGLLIVYFVSYKIFERLY
jgi:LPXTG-motif cell wall-anchored protein